MTSYPHIMRYLIMGVIIGGLPLLYRKTSTENESNTAMQGDGVSTQKSNTTVQQGKTGIQRSTGGASDYIFLVLGAAIVLCRASLSP